jgi:hypothetical protein
MAPPISAPTPTHSDFAIRQGETALKQLADESDEMTRSAGEVGRSMHSTCIPLRLPGCPSLDRRVWLTITFQAHPDTDSLTEVRVIAGPLTWPCWGQVGPAADAVQCRDGVLYP